MGAEFITTYGEGADPDTAFKAAMEAARAEHGDDGPTMAKKEDEGYVIITSESVLLSEAAALAQSLSCDPRVEDKWGPAGAVAVRGHRRTFELNIPEIMEGYTDLDDAARAAVAPHLIDGEQIANGISGHGKQDERTRRLMSGTVSVPTTGANCHTGWLFAGWCNDD